MAAAVNLAWLPFTADVLTSGERRISLARCRKPKRRPPDLRLSGADGTR